VSTGEKLPQGFTLKVCLLIPSLSGGGAEFVASQWARYLFSKGYQAYIYATHPKAADEVPQGVHIIRGKSQGFYADVRAFRRYLLDERIDCVVALMPYWNLMAVVTSATIQVQARPRVFISGRNSAKALGGVFGFNYKFKQWMAKLLYRHADGFIAISHPIAAEAVSEYQIAQKCVFVTPNPAIAKVEDRFTPRELEHIRNKNSKRSASDCINIVVPARLVRQKRPSIAILAAASIAQRHGLCAEVHFYGVGPLQPDVEALAAQLGVKAHFYGWKKYWFDACPPNSVLLLASLAEGFGNVLVEAAAVGIPSVASSRCLGSADAIIPGLSGQLIAGDSVDEYADAVVRSSTCSIGNLDAWLERFSLESSGYQMMTIVDPDATHRLSKLGDS